MNGGILSLCLNVKFVRTKIQILALTGNLKLKTISLVIKPSKTLGLQVSRITHLGEEPITIKPNCNGDNLLISYMDSSLHVLHSDTLKEHLKIYGHSLPIADFDTSTDEYILATISADKSLRVWDKDFGNCRKIINKCHDVAPLQIKIIKDTHYALTTGKDNFVKFWDLDSFQLVMRFEFLSENLISSLAISSIGHFFVAAGQGKSIRKFVQTREQILAEDTQKEVQDEQGILEELEDQERKELYYNSKDNPDQDDVPKKTRASRLKKFEMLKCAEQLMDLLEGIEKDSKSQFVDFENKVINLLKQEHHNKLKGGSLLGKRG